jgi:hypothetical protein
MMLRCVVGVAKRRCRSSADLLLPGMRGTKIVFCLLLGVSLVLITSYIVLMNNMILISHCSVQASIPVPVLFPKYIRAARHPPPESRQHNSLASASRSKVAKFAGTGTCSNLCVFCRQRKVGQTDHLQRHSTGRAK